MLSLIIANHWNIPTLLSSRWENSETLVRLENVIIQFLNLFINLLT